MNTEKDVYQLPLIDYLRLRFHLIAEKETQLPAFKGSMLRGAFGHALRKTVCAMAPQILCAKCMLRDQCAYTRLFETFISGEPPRFLRGLDTAPRPLIFESLETKQNFQAGDELVFDLILIGNKIDFLPYVIFAILQACDTGLGANREKFFLKDVECLQINENLPEIPGDPTPLSPPTTPGDNPREKWERLYDAHQQALLFMPHPTHIRNLYPHPAASTQMKIDIITPLQLKFDNETSMNFTFRQLTFKMLRRVLELAHFHQPKSEINWEFHDLLVAADDVKITQQNLYWANINRFSNRQQAKIRMNGFVGGMILEGNLAPFLNLISHCEILHFGKGTMFGLGKIKCQLC